MYRYGWKIVIAAPVLGQSSHIMEEAGNAAYRTCRKSMVHASGARVSIKGRPGKIVSVTGSVNANKQGAKGHIVIIDEKQDVPGATAAEDFIGMKIRGGCMWLVGVGGSPTSAGEMFKEDAYISTLPWMEYAKWDTDYEEEKVIPARRLCLPEQFAAHYEAQPLDTSSNILIPHINFYSGDLKGGYVRVGVDWGKRRDTSAATVVQTIDNVSYITEWLIPTGTYDEQMDKLTHWLKYDIEYDEVIAEDVGVGDSATDFLIRYMRDSKSGPSGIRGHGVSAKWKSDQAIMINKMAGNHTLLYNKDHTLAEMFYKEITSIGYKINDSNLCKTDHSDFLSSLMLGMEKSSNAYL